MTKNGINITTENTARKTLIRFFSGSPGASSVTPDEIYLAFGRNLEETDLNRQWLYNKLTRLKRHGLTEARYLQGSRGRRLDRIGLTPKGAAVLADAARGTDATKMAPPVPLEKRGSGIPEQSLPLRTATGERLTIETALAFLANWGRENPSFQVKVNVEVKK
jgi:DNA-binding PadR family transcriptional regulator